jgi:hypothetical protein
LEQKTFTATQQLSKQVPVHNIHATIQKWLETVFYMQPMPKLWSWVRDPKPTMTAGGGQQQFTTQTLVKGRETEKYGYGSCRAQNQERLCLQGPAANYCSAWGYSQWLEVSHQPVRTKAVERIANIRTHYQATNM